MCVCQNFETYKAQKSKPRREKRVGPKINHLESKQSLTFFFFVWIKTFF